MGDEEEAMKGTRWSPRRAGRRAGGGRLRRRRRRGQHRGKVEGGELSGTVTTWIMDPGSPKLQEVFKGYATDFEAKNPGTTVKIEFVPWAQAHDKFTTAIAGGKVPDVAEMGTTWTPEFADQGAFEQVPAAASRRVRLLAGRRRDARRRGLGQALVRRRARADLPQGRASRRPASRPPTTWDELKAAAADDQGEGRRHLPDRVQRPDRALLPADDLAGRRRDRHRGRRHAGRPR